MKRILIVEDDQLVATAYRKRFKDSGWEVEWAPDGVEGIKMVGLMKPDVVLLDLLMPRLDGIEVLKYIRGHPDLRHLPVVVFSNSYMTNLIENAWRAGADQCLMKASTTPQGLFDSIAKAIQKAAARMAAGGPGAGPGAAPVAPVTPAAGQRPLGESGPATPVGGLPSGGLPGAGPTASVVSPVDPRRNLAPPLPSPNLPVQAVPAVQPLAGAGGRTPVPASFITPATPSAPGALGTASSGAPAAGSAGGLTPGIGGMAADPGAGAGAATTAPPGLDPEFQAQIRQLFLAGAPAKIESIRALALRLAASPEANPAEQISELFRKVHSVTGNAAVAGCTAIAHHASTFEAFLQELQQKPRFVNGSTLRTILQGLDFVSLLFQHALDEEPPNQARRILVLDGDPMSGQAIALTLEKAGFRTHLAGDTNEALTLGASECFDLVVASTELPDSTGFEACSQLQTLPGCVHAPVLYVCPAGQFDACLRPENIGANDLIARPFLIIELTLKAQILLETRRFQTHFASAA